MFFCNFEVQRSLFQHFVVMTHHRPERVPSAVEDAVKYIIFLVDADTLFDVALGMYDFSLVLLVAQHAQKVPSFSTILSLRRYAEVVSRTLENTFRSYASSVR